MKIIVCGVWLWLLTFCLAVPISAAAGPSNAKVYDLKHVSVAPVLKTQVSPKYSEELRAAGVQGRVDVYLIVTSAGGVRNVRVVKSPDERLTKATLEAVAQWVFSPALVDGQAVDCAIIVPIAFSLDQTSPK